MACRCPPDCRTVPLPEPGGYAVRLLQHRRLPRGCPSQRSLGGPHRRVGPANERHVREPGLPFGDPPGGAPQSRRRQAGLLSRPLRRLRRFAGDRKLRLQRFRSLPRVLPRRDHRQAAAPAAAGTGERHAGRRDRLRHLRGGPSPGRLARRPGRELDERGEVPRDPDRHLRRLRRSAVPFPARRRLRRRDVRSRHEKDRRGRFLRAIRPVSAQPRRARPDAARRPHARRPGDRRHDREPRARRGRADRRRDDRHGRGRLGTTRLQVRGGNDLHRHPLGELSVGRALGARRRRRRRAGRNGRVAARRIGRRPSCRLRRSRAAAVPRAGSLDAGQERGLLRPGRRLGLAAVSAGRPRRIRQAARDILLRAAVGRDRRARRPP